MSVVLVTGGAGGIGSEISVHFARRGYDVAMIEFTSLEHTARNIMIKAVKRKAPNKYKEAAAQQQYEALRDFYQVKPTIDKL